MGNFKGGMEFQPGQPVRLPPPPATLPAMPLELFLRERPEVHAGQIVRQGQPLTQPRQLGQAACVSPASGIVREMAPEAGGGYRVRLEPTEATVPTALPIGPPRGRKLHQWFEALKNAGPWADRDGHVGLMAQLHAAQTAPPDTLICVGLDEYPPYADRSSLLTSFPDDTVLGTLILADLIGARHVSILAPRNAAVVSRLRPSCRNYRLKLKAIHNTYPSADPTLVTWRHATGNRALPYGANPVSVGVMLITPWTAIRVGRWFTLRKLDIVRPMIIAQPEAKASLCAAYAIAGQPLASLHPRLALDGGHRNLSLALGNPMTGKLLRRGDMAAGKPGAVVPYDQLLISILQDTVRPAADPCISCGWCADVCPTSLRPAYMLELARNHHQNDHLIDQLSFCIDCGLCSHVCPSELPLAQTFRACHDEHRQPIT
jgi:electron transport complex protein RnfC